MNKIMKKAAVNHVDRCPYFPLHKPVSLEYDMGASPQHPLRQLVSSNLVKNLPHNGMRVELPASQPTVSHIYSASFVGWFVGWRFNSETYKFKNQKIPIGKRVHDGRVAISNIILSRPRQMDLSLYAQQKSQGNGAW